MLNTDLVYRVADAVDSDSVSYDQRQWVSYHRCGTAYCFGGQTMVQEGWVAIDEYWYKEGHNKIHLNNTGVWAARFLGLKSDTPDYPRLGASIFRASFRPHSHLTPGEAFRKFCEGAPIEEVGETE